MKLGPNSKPHRNNAGYVCEMKAKLGGHIVIYDRNQPNVDICADHRWIVMHEPSSLHIAIESLKAARQVMQGVARSTSIEEANQRAQIIPQPAANPSMAVDDDGADITVRNEKRLAKKAKDDAERKAALDRFLADPENEPSEEGKAALKRAFS